MRLSSDSNRSYAFLYRFGIVFCLLSLLALTGCPVSDDGGGGDFSLGPIGPGPTPDPGPGPQPEPEENQPPAPSAPAIDTTIDTPGRSQISANDPDEEQTHTFALSILPTNGSATFDENTPGLLIYTPDTGFTGSDSLEATVTDDGDPPLSATVTIDITVSPGVPTDLNGDGLPDLVTVNQFASSVTILSGQVDNTFVEDSTVSPVPTGTSPSALAVVDLNNDGRPDLITANQDPGSISILFGQTDGTFAEDPNVSPVPTGTEPAALNVADLNGDGRLDLITANQNPGSISILFGQTDGTFAEDAGISPVATGASPAALAVVDLNGDGQPDLITANQAAGNISILFGQTDGTFVEDTGVSPVATGAGPTDLAVADLNDDGRLDLITANRDADTITILFAQTDGTFAEDPGVSPLSTGANPVALLVVDLNADGQPDLITANQAAGNISIFFGQTDGTFAEDGNVSPVSTNASPVALAAADLNADERLDLLTANLLSNSVTILFAQPDGTFAPDPNIPPIPTGTGPTDLAVVE